MQNRHASLTGTATTFILWFMWWPVATFLLGSAMALTLLCLKDFSTPALNRLVLYCVLSPFVLNLTVPIGIVMLVVKILLSGYRAPGQRATVQTWRAPERAEFEHARLEQTWFAHLSLAGIDLPAGAPSAPNWRCAIDRAHRVLFMRLPDGPDPQDEAHYLLALGGDVIIVAAYAGMVRILPMGAWRSHAPAVLNDLAVQGIACLTRRVHRAGGP